MKIEKLQRSNESRALSSQSKEAEIGFVDNRNKSNLTETIQKQDRRTTIYGRNSDNHNQWDKNMEIIDSISPSEYVHISRSTITDSAHFNVQEHNVPEGVVYNAGRYAGEETAPIAHPHFNYDLYNEDNNGHITLEGRYVQVLKTLTSGFDNRVPIKAGPPVGQYNNLNFGNQPQISQYDITQYIENTADDAEDYIRQNYDNEDGRRDDLIETLNETKDSTLSFTDHLISNTPYLRELNEAQSINHYGGGPWRLVWNDNIE